MGGFSANGALSHPFLGWEGSPVPLRAKIDYRKKSWYPYSELSTGGPTLRGRYLVTLCLGMEHLPIAKRRKSQRQVNQRVNYKTRVAEESNHTFDFPLRWFNQKVYRPATQRVSAGNRLKQPRRRVVQLCNSDFLLLYSRRCILPRDVRTSVFCQLMGFPY